MAKKGLGKGLGSFFENENMPSITEEISAISESNSELSLTKIEPNKNQPRRVFDKEKIAALADSIKQQGLIQPIVVTKQDNGRYMIVAGERRWRAAKQAGLKKVPVIIKEYSPSQIAQIALMENLQREDLNPIEEAVGYRSLLETYSLTQESISRLMGKSRSAIANSIRLLSLDDEIQEYLASGKLSSGHARAILSIDDTNRRKELAQRIIKEDLSVRQAEALSKAKQQKSKKTPMDSVYKIEIEHIEEKIASCYGTKVKISHTPKKGKIEIEYYGNEDLERILGLMNV